MMMAHPDGGREDSATRPRKGRRRWGRALLLVLGLALFINIPDYLGYGKYREWQEWLAVSEQQLRGPCDGGAETTLQAAVIGDATYSGFSPVYGCGNLEAYRRLAKIELRHVKRVQAKGGMEAEDKERERFKRLFGESAARGECRAMPAGARVSVAECHPHTALLRMPPRRALKAKTPPGGWPAPG